MSQNLITLLNEIYWKIDHQIEELEELHCDLGEANVNHEIFENKLVAIIGDLADIKNNNFRVKE